MKTEEFRQRKNGLLADKTQCASLGSFINEVRSMSRRHRRNGTEEQISPLALHLFGSQVKKILGLKKRNEELAERLDNMVAGTMSRSRLMCCLPRDKQNSYSYVRETSNLRFGLQAIESAGLGLPFGVTSRKILAFIDTLIKSDRLDGRRIWLGTSRRETAMMFGFQADGDDVIEFYKHLKILANTIIFIRPLARNYRTSKVTTLGRGQNITIISGFNDEDLVLLGHHGKHIVPFKRGWIEISQDYIEHVKKDAIPIDIKYYQSLSSSLEMDLYPYFNLAVYPVEKQFEDNKIISKKLLFEEVGPILENNLTAKQITSRKRRFITSVKQYLDRCKAQQNPFPNFNFESDRNAFIITDGESSLMDRKKKARVQAFVKATRTS